MFTNKRRDVRMGPAMVLAHRCAFVCGLLFLLLLSAACVGHGLDVDDHALKEGDVIFQTSRSPQSQAIQLATHSSWSHMGMLVLEHGIWMVIEAVQPVKYTPLSEWVSRGKGGHFVLKRLQDREHPLDAATLVRMRKIGKRFLGKPYDLTFEWDDRQIYCSELVWKIYKEGAGIELGSLQRLKDFDLSHPVVQKKLRERYGSKVPMEEPVISSQTIFECPLLTTVAQQ